MNMDLVSRAAEAYLQTVEGSDAARLRFLTGLWEVQADIESAGAPYDPPDAEAAKDALVTGQPLFLVSAPSVPLTAYTDAVARIARYVSEHAGLPAEQADALCDADFAAAIDEHALAGAFRSPDTFVADVADAMGVEPEGTLTAATVAFVLVSALVPFLTGPSRAALGTLSGAGRALWTGGDCPVCGGAASMGRMGESTQMKGAERTLWCGMCHAEWGYERIRCVRCGARNPGKLRYSHLEEDPAHRVHLCDECKGYTRFVFVDEVDKPVSMQVEDAMSAILDVVAADIGYTVTGDGGPKA